MFESSAFESASFEALTDDATEGAFSWSGEADFDFVGTTSFIALIESGRGSMSFAAEIFLRSL